MNEILPILVRWVPALVDVIAAALGGAFHKDEGAWCAHIKDLEDVCAALRAGDKPTVTLVQDLLRDVRPDALRLAKMALQARLRVGR